MKDGHKSDAKSEVERWNSEREPEVRTFASGQYICEIAYYLAKENPLPEKIRVLNENGQLNQYYVQQIPLKPGFFAYILAPTNKDKCQDVKVIFRGTDFSDPNSALMNLEQGGPGVESFDAEKDTIFDCLEEVLSRHPKSTISVYGHSLGGALAQLFMAEFLERRYLADNFPNIDSLNMTILNSPGVPPNTANKAAYYTEQIKQSDPFKVVTNYGMVGGDPVQTTGLAMLFADSPPEVAKVNVLKLDRGFEGHWFRDFNFNDGVQLNELIQMFKNFVASFRAHQNINFFAPMVTDETGRINVDLPKSHRAYYRNDSLEERQCLKDELLNKILLPSYGFYLATETLQMMNIGYLSEFIPSSACRMGKALLNWFTPVSPLQHEINENPYEVNENRVLVQRKPHF